MAAKKAETVMEEITIVWSNTEPGKAKTMTGLLQHTDETGIIVSKDKLKLHIPHTSIKYYFTKEEDAAEETKSE